MPYYDSTSLGAMDPKVHTPLRKLPVGPTMRSASKISIAAVVLVLVVVSIAVIIETKLYRLLDAGRFQSLCKSGDAFACYKLGTMYEFGQYVSADPTQAQFYYEKACSMDKKWGCEEASRLGEPKSSKPN